MPNGPMRITSGPFEPELYKSEMEVQDAELKVSVEWKMGTMGHVPMASPEKNCQSRRRVLSVPHFSAFAFLLSSRLFSRVLQVEKPRKRRKRRCVMISWGEIFSDNGGL